MAVSNVRVWRAFHFQFLKRAGSYLSAAQTTAGLPPIMGVQGPSMVFSSTNQLPHCSLCSVKTVLTVPGNLNIIPQSLGSRRRLKIFCKAAFSWYNIKYSYLLTHIIFKRRLGRGQYSKRRITCDVIKGILRGNERSRHTLDS